MGTAMAPQSAMPKSATVHSRRVPAMMETISPFFIPSERNPQPASSLSFASCAQLTSCQPPETFRRAAVRCASVPARWRKSCATDWMLASSLRCFCIALTWLCAVAMLVFPLLSGIRRSVRFDPIPGLLLQAPFLRLILAGRRVEDLPHELHAFLDPVRIGVAVREVQLRAQIGRVGAHGFGQHLGGLADVALGPGKLEEVAPPHDLRRTVQVVLVLPQRRQDAVAELSFQALRQRSDDPDAFRVQPDPHTPVVMPADVAGIRRDRL